MIFHCPCGMDVVVPGPERAEQIQATIDGTPPAGIEHGGKRVTVPPAMVVLHSASHGEDGQR
jgi:hypothetical protein